MGNTIRTPRKRPRVRSLNWRALWWLIATEALYTAWRGLNGMTDYPGRRRWFYAEVLARVDHHQWASRWDAVARGFGP